MKKLLNTLYVTVQGAWLSRRGETVRVVVDGQARLQVPVHTLESVVCFGRILCTPQLLGLCAQKGVGVVFLSRHGRFRARVQGPVQGNVLLRRTQYHWADDKERCACIARNIVTAKIGNCRQVLMRAIREGGGPSSLKQAANDLARHQRALQKDQVSATIVGREGDAARRYFKVFQHLIKAQQQSFTFERRSRRPPLDPMNALLSFLYTLLAQETLSALEAAGLDPFVGFLHRDRPGRPSLALDLMEELRPILADRLALSLVNRRQVTPQGFRCTETGAVLMKDDARKKVLATYQSRKREEITHPFLKERMPIGLLPHVQSLLLARFIRGDLDGYPPFFWK